MTSRARTDRTAVALATAKGSFCVGNVYYEGGSNQTWVSFARGEEVQGKASKRRYMGTYTETRMGALAISVYLKA